jgi:hypothetical protein
MKNLSKEQIVELKKFIDEELEVRCIKVETKLVEIEREKFQLTSTNFQTVPVIHKNLSIINFGGGKYQNEEKKDIIDLYVPVAVSYQGNCVSLFTVHAVINKKNNKDVWLQSIKK